MFSQMFLFIGVISATKENIVKHIIIIKWHCIKQSPCNKGVSCQFFSP